MKAKAKCGTLILFVKAPRLGAVKTRLGKTIGAFAAWRFYNGMLATLWQRLGYDRRWRTVAAVSPDQGFTRWPRRIPRQPQGRGDLGQRMARAMGAHAGPVVLVGGDIPDLSPKHVAQAMKALRRADVVFGPAADGGFWLVGLRRSQGARQLFKNARWSSPHALADCLSNLPGTARVVMLETLSDIDTQADFEAYQDRN
ncbi:MAG: TIGR04282 family arsenosugar biosynthesis glycosyltransferase [Alphaproteobacteria bacterium]|nr:TIGR04282 family arsenosugar biosynthesis glycosyltransferase [Alphaproteobacteria bacterium]